MKSITDPNTFPISQFWKWQSFAPQPCNCETMHCKIPWPAHIQIEQSDRSATLESRGNAAKEKKNRKNQKMVAVAHICRLWCVFARFSIYILIRSQFDGFDRRNGISSSSSAVCSLSTIHIECCFLHFYFSLSQSNLSNKFDIYCEYPFCFVLDRNVCARCAVQHYTHRSSIECVKSGGD